jgi:hypothetical protein
MHYLVRLLWQTFPNLRQMIKLTCAQGNAFQLPVDRYGGNFDREAKHQGIDLDQMSFEIVRDLATEFMILNWRPVLVDNRQYQRVYSVGTASNSATLTTHDACQRLPANSNQLVVQQPVRALHCLPDPPHGLWSFISNTVALETLEQSVWRHYMSLTERVPRFPVLYTDLRDAVCESLAIPDPYFDAMLQGLIQRPSRIDIYPAEGVLDYSAKLAITYKQVPPRTATGQFMTFLKIDRRS